MLARILRPSAKQNQDIYLSALELTTSVLRTLMSTVGGIYLAFHVIVTASWPDLYGGTVWGMTFLLASTTGLAFWLLKRSLLLAQSVWQVGMLGGITIALYGFAYPNLAYLYAFLPFISTVIVGWQAGVVAELVILLVVGFLTWGVAPVLFVDLAIGVGVGGALTILLGWASSRVLYTVTQWSLYAHEQAIMHMSEARERRAQMAKVVKDLDQAYYRLERTNTALVAAWRAADKAERFRATFATNLSHELRTPLNLIIGFSEMMITSPENYGGALLPGPYRADLESIYHNTHHLLDLANDVLDMARIDVDKVGLSRSEVDFGELVQEALDMVAEYTTAKGLSLGARIAPDLEKLYVDRLRIRQVLLNLLVNAARFTEEGSITVQVQKRGPEVLVEVSDTGRGIRPEDLPTVFEEFGTTAEQGSRGWSSGTGLGLPISRTFVELHHGRMGVESTYGQGTSFWFTLPCRASVDADDEPALGLHRTMPLTRIGKSERILVCVHKDPRVAAMLNRYLDGYRVVGVPTVEQAVERAQEMQALGAILGTEVLDADMPANLPYVQCRLPSYSAAARAMGADDILSKPVSTEELWAGIDRVCLTPNHVLVVDDEPEMVSLLQRMLRTRVPAGGCREAFSGEDALRLMRDNKPDLVLLDLLMPGMSGRQVLKEMSSDQELVDIPVIVVTAETSDDLGADRCSSLHIAGSEGFGFGETMRVLQSVFDTLTPGWH